MNDSRRKQWRYELAPPERFPVALQGPDGLVVRGEAVDVSPGGLGVRFTEPLPGLPADAPLVAVLFLPPPGRETRLPCRLASRRGDAAQTFLGLCFLPSANQAADDHTAKWPVYRFLVQLSRKRLIDWEARFFTSPVAPSSRQ